MRFPGFIGPSYTLASVSVDAQRCINLIPEVVESGSGKEQSQFFYRGSPGLTTLLTLPTSPYRGSFTASNGTLYAVGGNKLYSISSSWVATERGTLLTSTGKVSMAENGIHLCIVDNPYGYTLTFSTNAFAQITDTDFTALGAANVISQDGYFLHIKPSSGQFFISGLNAITYDALDIATSEGSPDNLVASISVNRDIWMFNDKTTEIFYNSGNADFPFERAQGAFIQVGCAAKHSVAVLGNSPVWLGQDDKGSGIIYRAQGQSPQRISTHAVEEAIRTYGDVSAAVAYTYQEAGHEYYVINFATADSTWVYDLTTGLWHERAYLNDGAQERHRADGHSFAYSTHVVGDYATGKLYSMSLSTYSDDGQEILRRRRAPHASAGLKRASHHSFQLDAEVGVGLDGTNNDTDPQIMLRWSDDGGYTWSNERQAALGKIGARKQRVIFRRLGMSRDRVYEVTFTGKVKVVWIGAELDIQAEAS